MQIGPGAPGSDNQEQDYEAELRGATWAAEREVSNHTFLHGPQ
jgi:hypothetical protein